MFELVDLYEGDKNLDVKNEEELSWNIGPDKRIRFSKLLEWINNVGGTENAKYLKCLISKNKGGDKSVEIASITGIEIGQNLVHHDASFDNAVVIAFQEGGNAPAMTIGDAVSLMNEIAATCNESGISLDDVEVFTRDSKSKLTQFCWYYDTDTDTACIVKNMNPKAAGRFMRTGSQLIAKAAETPVISDKLIDELAKVEAQMNALNAKKEDIYKRMEGVSENEKEEKEAEEK